MKRIFVFLLLFAATAFAQMPTPKPGPELKNLDYFVGNWSAQGEMKPGPMGPGGKMNSSSKISWMNGGFFLVMQNEYSGGGMGTGTGTAYMGYDPETKMYTYHEFDSMGQASSSVGTLNGDTWVFNSDEKMGGMAFKGRFTMKILSPTSYNFMFEMSTDGGTKWVTAMEGKATKQ